jgi:tetratricopeptide (TPR) repeat protein
MAMQGNQKQGIPLVEQSLALYQSMGDKLGQAYALDWLSINQSNPERSKAYLVESLRLYRELGHLWGIAYCLSDLGQLTIGAGDFSFALDCLKEAKEIFRELGNQAGEAWVLNFWGTLAYRQSDYQQACDYFDEAIALFERLGLSGSYWPRVHLAYTFLRQGNLTKARDSFDLGIRLFREEGNVIGVIYAMEGIASLYLIQEKAEHATKLTGWADALRETIGNYRSPLEQNDVDKNITACLARMGKAAFSDAYENGKNMSLEEAITFALERGF